MPLRSLGELERAALDVLWAATEPLSVRDIHTALALDRDLAYTTVMTVLDRMAKKDLVTRSREGRAFVYRAAGTRAAMTADLMRDALAEFSVDDRGTALVAFVTEAGEEEREALRRALAALEDQP
ncbi:BlaI/MecI/CopY family transcriptional regulator [Nocardioides acrostichi]|uniref:BlaI/MecI/CopY family transcriptional regulator n=1 Tax=Nocardioides acrostichi TaxID=2784339 RepID=UPI0038B40EAE